MGMGTQGSAEGLVRQEGQSCRGKDSPGEGSSEQQLGPWHQALTLLQMQKSGHTRSSGLAHKQRPVSHSAPGGEAQPPSQAFLGHALCQPLRRQDIAGLTPALTQGLSWALEWGQEGN